MNAMFTSLETRKLRTSVTATAVNGQLPIAATSGRDPLGVKDKEVGHLIADRDIDGPDRDFCNRRKR